MKALAQLFLVLVVSIASFSDAGAQCKNFTKRKCIPQMAPYINNGQYNGATLFEGETASVMMTFYSGQDYRLIVCSQDILKGTYFEIKDEDGNLLYTNKDKDSDVWDFNVASTQQLMVEVTVPQTSTHDVKNSGCVSILVGFLE
ncbi:MAG: hypothetical protein ACFB10_12525 [Salibacteraceae bacterium]